MGNIFTKSLPFKIVKLITRLIFFVICWLFLWLSYGDVLYQLQDQSLWFFASLKEFQQLKINIDIFTYIARFCLTIFYFPILGALVLSIILSLIEFLTDKILRLKPLYYILSYVPSVALLFYICSHDSTIYLGHENSEIFKVLLIALAVFVVIFLVSLFFRQKRDNKLDYQISITYPVFYLCSFVLSVFFANLYANRNPEFNTICSLKYYTDQKKWGKVASIAEKSDLSNKNIAGYHVLALAQMGQVGDRLFHVDYDFPIQKSFTKWDDIVYGSAICNPQLLFYAGLIQPTYHYSFEYFIIYGNFKGYLKMMAKSLVVNQDHILAKRMLDILARVPFEGDFVKKYSGYNQNPDQMKGDPELAPVIDIKQHFEDFEQGFGLPLVVNFYTRLGVKNISQRAQDLALASCLYYKNLQLFAYKCAILMKRNSVPKHFQEAIAMIAAANHNTELLKLYKISPEINANVTNFLTEQARHKNDADKGKSSMSAFKGTLMYYMAFENDKLLVSK